MSLTDSYLCKICPGNLRISPASAAEKHKEWHKEQDRMHKAGDWQFGSSVGKTSRRKPPGHHPKTGKQLMDEGIPIKNVNRAMNNE